MTAKACNFGNSGDWVTVLDESKKPVLLNQVFNLARPRNADLKPPKDDGVESVYFCKNFGNRSNKHKKLKKRKPVKRKSAGSVNTPPTKPIVYQKIRDDLRPMYFKPYTTSCYRHNNLYKVDVTPKYLNGTVASELKRVIPYKYWQLGRPNMEPFVTTVFTKHTHNVHLLKQETFAKMKAAILPFRSEELDNQNINSLRSIKRSIERYWQLQI